MTTAEGIRLANAIEGNARMLRLAIRNLQRTDSVSAWDNVVAYLTAIQRDAGRVRAGLVTPNQKAEK